MTIKPAPHRLSRADFIAAFGGIYEHSPWVAERLFDAGLSAHDANPANLARRMAEIVDAAGYDKQMALLCAHPELAGKLAIAGSLTAESTAEQASAKLDQCNAEEFATFQDLNDRYGKNSAIPLSSLFAVLIAPPFWKPLANALRIPPKRNLPLRLAKCIKLRGFG